MKTVVLATHNAKKLAELRRVLADSGLDVEVKGLAEVAQYLEPAETELSFEGNSELKARICVEKTGFAALADDSGLCLDVLNGMPGIRSARWAGPNASDQDNVELLLRQITDVPLSQRGAKFVCVMTLVLPSGDTYAVRGEMPGTITDQPCGSGGFGYDPIFVPTDSQLTTAQMTPAAKDAISHRGKAVRDMVELMSDLIANGKF
ncbi:MAG: RdgB/HAM1 family non-canonical purine NTP pyrophosphatase [Propionibacteriaceae bacterium]